MSVPIEIERRFLVIGDEWRPLVCAPQSIRQGYLPVGKGITMRIRRLDGQGFLAIKTARHDCSRVELEYEIPSDHADFLLATLCDHPLLEKLRYGLLHAGQSWVVDEFVGVNHGLVIAEAEIETPRQYLPLPPWVGREITDCCQFHNSYLAHHPFSDVWTTEGGRYPTAAGWWLNPRNR